MELQSKTLIKGGEFIIKETQPEDIFTPEDFSEEQIMMKDSVKEFVDRDVLAHALAAACLHHELARQSVGRRGLQRAQHDGLLQRIPGHDIPVVEDRQAEGLALGVDADVGFKAEGLDRRDEALDLV